MVILPPNASQTNVMESPVRYGPTKVVLLVPVSSNITTGLGGTEILNELMLSVFKWTYQVHFNCFDTLKPQLW